MIEELTKLAQDLYNQGYHCGISGKHSEEWFTAWAMAMARVAAGDKYTDRLVIACFHEILPGEL